MKKKDLLNLLGEVIFVFPDTFNYKKFNFSQQKND